MNVRSSNNVSCYPAPSEVDSNHGNPCSLVGNSLFPKSGNTPGGTPKIDQITEAASPGSPDFGVFPCIFPANQGFAPRDEFATDCTLRHLVCVSRDLLIRARSAGTFPRFRGVLGEGLGVVQAETAGRRGQWRNSRPFSPRAIETVRIGGWGCPVRLLKTITLLLAGC